MSDIESSNTDRICTLNDALRITGVGGRVMITACVAALRDDEGQQVFEAVRSFEAFTAENDLYGEHDCASVVVGEHRIIWKIDCFDLDLSAHSNDPADPTVTQRAISIMLAEEY